jgi:hypothetical protein|tara:strand:+ start:215 stop:475 length:261 start_codon:yes stop_codon:yes gene_type:complete
MPIELKPNGKDYPDKPRKAAPSAEVGDDGANFRSTMIQKNRMQDRIDSAVGKIKKFENKPGYTLKDAGESIRKKRIAKRRNDPVST